MVNISIIIPVYNREKYIGTCLKSLIQPHMEGIEIIVVDDGSNDKTSDICNKFSKDYSFVRVIRQFNSGVAAARNTGIAAAKGKWIAWVDSDDRVSSNYIETLQLLKNYLEYDVIIFKYETFYDNSKLDNLKNSNSVDIRINHISKEKCFNSLNNIKIGNFLWNKLFKRELYENISFPRGKVYEDIATTYKLLSRANSIGISKNIIYYYRQHPESIVHEEKGAKALKLLGERIEAQKSLTYFLKDNYPDAFQAQIRILAIISLEYIKRYKYKEDNSDCMLNKCRQFIKNYRPNLKSDGLKLCIKIFMCSNFFNIYKWIYRNNQ